MLWINKYVYVYSLYVYRTINSLECIIIIIKQFKH